MRTSSSSSSVSSLSSGKSNNAPSNALNNTSTPSPLRIVAVYLLACALLYAGIFLALMVNEFSLSAIDMDKLYYCISSESFNLSVNKLFHALYNVLLSTAMGIALFHVICRPTQRKDNQLITQIANYIAKYDAASGERMERHINNVLTRKVPLPASIQHLVDGSPMSST